MATTPTPGRRTPLAPSTTDPAGRRTPLRGRRIRPDGEEEEPMAPSSVTILRKRALLRSFGPNYLRDAAHPGLGLLCVADGAEFHLYHFRTANDEPARHAGCVLRPASLVSVGGGSSSGIQYHALHAAWAPEATRPTGLMAVAWPRAVVFYRVEVEGEKVGATRLGEVRLERKPSGLAWHPAACVPLLAIHDITDVTLVQLPRARDADGEGDAGGIYMPPPSPAPSARGTPLRGGTPFRGTPSRASIYTTAQPPTPPRTPSRASIVPEPLNTHSSSTPTLKISSSLPGALEAIAWSQRGHHLAVCMEGVLRVYDWPNPNQPLQHLDAGAIVFVDTRLRRRVRAIRAAGPQGFAAATEMELGLLGGGGSSAAAALGGRRSPAVGVGGGMMTRPTTPSSSSVPATASSLHLIHVAEPAAGDKGGASRLIDVETAAVAHVAMPDLLAVTPVGGGGRGPGEPATHALAAVGSHTADTISVFRLSAHAAVGAPGASVAPLFTVQLPPSTRPKGLAFVGSRLVILTGVREGAAGLVASASSVGEFSTSLAVYSLPPDIFNLHFRPSTPTRYAAALETQRVYPPSQQARFAASPGGGSHPPVSPFPYSRTATPMRPGPFNSSTPSSRAPSRVSFAGYAPPISPAPSTGSALLEPQLHNRMLGAPQPPRGYHPAVGPSGPQPHSQMGTPMPIRAFAPPADPSTTMGSSSLSRSNNLVSPSATLRLAAVGRATGLGKPKGPPASPDRGLTGGGARVCFSPGLTGRLLHDVPALNTTSNPPSLGGTPRGYGAASPVLAGRGGRSGSSLSLSGGASGIRAASPVGLSATHSAATGASTFFFTGSVHRSHQHQQQVPPPPPPPPPQPQYQQQAPPPPPPPPPQQQQYQQQRQAPPTLEQLSAAVAAMAAEERRQEQEEHEQEHRRHGTGVSYVSASVASGYSHSHHSTAAPSASVIVAEEEAVAEVEEAEAGRKSATTVRGDSPSPLLPTSVSPVPYPSASPRPPSVLMMATGRIDGDEGDLFATGHGRRSSMGGGGGVTPGATADRLFGATTAGTGSRPGTSYSHLWPSQPPASARATPFAVAPEDGEGEADGLFGGSAPVVGGESEDPFPFSAHTAMPPPPPPPPPSAPQQYQELDDSYTGLSVRRASPVHVPPPPPPPPGHPPKAPAGVTFYNPSSVQHAPPPPPPPVPQQQQQQAAAVPYNIADNTGARGMWGP